jgi:phytoene desaturase
MLLAARGFDVEVFEKRPVLGGRTSALEVNGFRFDVGPTFLMMKFLLDDLFEEAETRSSEYLKFTRLDPMYELRVGDRKIRFGVDAAETKAEIERHYPGRSGGFDRFLAYERKRFARIIPCLQRPYLSLPSMISWPLMKSVPYLGLGRSVFDVLKGYFGHDELALLFSFQSKYLGMSAWRCPGGFSMLSYIEHAYGIFHTEGGLSEIPRAMARVAEERGARIRVSAPVKQLVLDGRSVRGVELEGGEKVAGDAVVLNADFAHAVNGLIPTGTLKKFAPERVERMKFSCSTFMLHLGIRGTLDLPHHTILFARDYRRNVQEIFERDVLSRDISFYVRNASVTDPTLAPAGMSSLYVLVPVPNLKAPIDWVHERGAFRELVLDAIEERLGISGLRERIVVERGMSPSDWASDLSIYRGATFNLAHNLGQLAYWRPRNQFEELDDLYLAGGGTHPGSGLPTILESARISANLICRRFNVPFTTKEVHV